MFLMNSQNKKIKVAFVIGNFSIGGAERLVIDQINGIDKEIFEPFLVTLLPKPANVIGGLIDLSESKIAQFKFQSFYDWCSWLRLIKFMRRQRFDIVYTHLFFANLVARAAAIMARIPVIISVEHNIYRGKKPIYILADRILAKFTDKIITVSHSVKEFTIKQERIESDKFDVIYNGVDISPVKFDKDAKRKELGIDAENLVVASVGRISEQKGFIFLVRAAKELIPRFTHAKFLIIGPVEEKATFKMLQDEIGQDLSDRIILLGPRHDIKEILAASDIFVLPSLWEGFGISALEAMAAGLPIIASNIDGLKEFIKNNENGILVSKGDTEALIRAISRLAADSDLRIRLASSARQTAQKFSINENIRQLETLFLNLFDEKSA